MELDRVRDALLRRLAAAGDAEFVEPAPPLEPGSAALPVTVVIPAYNREVLLPRALASVAAQEVAPEQVIVVDDGSTDATASIAEAAGAHVLRLQANAGAATARLAGVRAARTRWVAFLDSDDEWLPWMLSSLWPNREGHAVVAGASAWFRDGRLGRYEGLPFGDAAVLHSPRALVWPQNFIPAAGTLADREALLRASPEAPQYRYSEDFATWLRMLRAGTALVLARPVVRYHLHAEQKTASDARLVDQHAMVRDIVEPAWEWGARQRRRRMAVDAWDVARTRRPRMPLAALLRRTLRPSRAVAVAGVLAWRRLQGRRVERFAQELRSG